jgi:uroporphyrinogen decarboxylase
MNGDKMTPIERWKALVTGDPVDRVPVMPLSQGHTALINGYPNLGDFYSKLDVMVRCQEIGKELYGYDQPIQLLCIGVIAEFGTKILWPYNPKMGSAVAADHPVKKAEDVDKLEVPDITKSAVAKQVVELSKKLMAKKEMPMVLIGGGWITMVTPWLVSMENFMRWVIYQPELCHKLIKKSCDFGIQQIEYYTRELGAEGWMPWDAAPTDSNVLVSPKVFGDFVLPSVVRLHQRGLDLGVPGWFTHWCSNHNGNIKAGHVDKIPNGKHGMIQFGPEVDLKNAVERFGSKYIVMGNVDPPSMMLKTHEECLQLAKQDIDKGKHSPKGYILGVGCELPPRAPPANVYALVKASREYGRY